MGFLQKLLEAIFGNKKSSPQPKPEAKTPAPKPPRPPVSEEEVSPVIKEGMSSDEQETIAKETVPEPEEEATPPVVESTPETEKEIAPPVVESAPEPEEEKTASPTVAAEERPEAPISEQLIEGAKKYVGTPYLYGGTTPEGFDCSGFVGQVFEDMGMDLPRTSRQQAELGTRIDISEVQTGDLVFFSHSGGRIDHVGIITSNKGEPMKMVHASTSKGVIFSDLENSTYWKPRITNAQRVLGV